MLCYTVLRSSHALLHRLIALKLPYRLAQLTLKLFHLPSSLAPLMLWPTPSSMQLIMLCYTV